MKRNYIITKVWHARTTRSCRAVHDSLHHAELFIETAERSRSNSLCGSRCNSRCNSRCSSRYNSPSLFGQCFSFEKMRTSENWSKRLSEKLPPVSHHSTAALCAANPDPENVRKLPEKLAIEKKMLGRKKSPLKRRVRAHEGAKTRPGAHEAPQTLKTRAALSPIRPIEEALRERLAVLLSCSSRPSRTRKKNLEEKKTSRTL